MLLVTSSQPFIHQLTEQTLLICQSPILPCSAYRPLLQVTQQASMGSCSLSDLVAGIASWT